MFSKGNMNKLMKQAKEMQDKMMQTQKEIELVQDWLRKGPFRSDI